MQDQLFRIFYKPLLDYKTLQSLYEHDEYTRFWKCQKTVMPMANFVCIILTTLKCCKNIHITSTSWHKYINIKYRWNFNPFIPWYEYSYSRPVNFSKYSWGRVCIKTSLLKYTLMVCNFPLAMLQKIFSRFGI